MERCPNCGATVRAGAKFCTTCGMRLPETSGSGSESPSPTTSRSPFESTSSVTTSRWPAERPSQPATGEASSGYAVSSSGTPEAKAPDQPVAEKAESPETVDTPAAPESADADKEEKTAWPPLGSSTSWDSRWRSSSGEESAAEEVSETPPAEVAAPDDAEAVEPPVTGTEIGQDTAVMAAVGEDKATDEVVVEDVELDAAPVDTDAEASEEAEAAPEQQAAPVEIESAAAIDVEAETEAAAVEAAEQQPGPSDLVAAPATGGGLDRVYALIDELRTSVSGLSGETVQQVDVTAIADGLAEARSTESDDEFDRLRTAIATARDRPRDIDTMLDVSGRLDAIASLDEAYQRLAEAVDSAVDALRATSGE